MEAGTIGESDDGDVVAVAEANETGSLVTRIAVKNTGLACRLVGNDADCHTGELCKSNDYVLGEVFLDLEEGALVEDCIDNDFDVVGFVGILGNKEIDIKGFLIDISGRCVGLFSCRMRDI